MIPIESSRMVEDCLHNLFFTKCMKFLKQSTCLFSSWCWTWSTGFGDLLFRFLCIVRLSFGLCLDILLSQLNELIHHVMMQDLSVREMNFHTTWWYALVLFLTSKNKGSVFHSDFVNVTWRTYLFWSQKVMIAFFICCRFVLNELALWII